MTREEFDYSFGRATIFTENWPGTRYRYGYRSRPFGMKCQPDGFIQGSYYSDFADRTLRIRHGVIEYPFELTTEEVYDFELVPMEVTCVNGKG